MNHQSTARYYVNPDLATHSGLATYAQMFPFPGCTLLDLLTVLQPLALNGGSTRTHALVADSLAIDAGDNERAVDPAQDSAPLPNDQRGTRFERMFDGGSGTETVDIGAYERQPVNGLSLIVGTHIDEMDGDDPGEILSLREAVALANGSVVANSITFLPNLAGSTISLVPEFGQLTITDSLTITGPTNGSVTIDAGKQGFRVFDVTAAAGDVTFENLTITGGQKPTGEHGGGIRFLPSTGTLTLTVTNSTISGNTAGRSGGGIYNSGTATVTNSIVAGNTASSNVDIDNSGTLTGLHNLIGGPASAGGLTDGNILGDGNGNLLAIATILQPLAFNGGPTQTHALLPGSPAVDAGDNILAVAPDSSPLTTDQALFGIDAATGVLTFVAAPDFENPTDADTDNVFDLQVTVTDNGTGNLTAVQNIAITVTDVVEATVTVADVSQTESGGLLFTVTLEIAVPGGFDVNVSFTDGTAVGGADYDNAGQTLIFVGGVRETHP